MINKGAKISVRLGDYMGPFRGEADISATIAIDDSFCGIHDGYHIQSIMTNGGNTTYCGKCYDAFASAMADELSRKNIDSGVSVSIPCRKIHHTHSCSCHLGHECDVGCDAAEDDAHPLVQLASTAPNDAMMGVYERLDKLEREHAAIGKLLADAMREVPEEIIQSSTWSALREKMNLDDTSGGIEGI